ncbi:MAG: L-ribulose-5-phosphate 4-epimerase [Erysipelotrichaceae bacterium]|jgi:L-ribulose-5-phosphate 4-epimerase|nr:L-ribulose-5-phosphate 4-epimerase [Erysipelotrichaceae bacterium]
MSSSNSELIKRVYRANLLLPAYGLVTFTWGNVSEIDRNLGIVVIKPSGISYTSMKEEDMVVTDLKGNILSGRLRPSSDLPTHLALYEAFASVKAIVHTHSTFATAFAQARMDLRALGTTHADTFYGSIPCTRLMHVEEIQGDYERNTGLVIVEEFVNRKIKAEEVPGVLVANHGPFVWGNSAIEAVEHAKILEEVAKMNYLTCNIDSSVAAMQQELLDKHFLRKHGANAYYGQKK